ncbi:helix-turn-helix domain-containing protein [Actinomadura macrotermitis]|uniref:HTH luxR-type domain-containing protein n=1 Tax=Actinomadura macrotermitis TaxID=2585200 RepID=A0A7K0C7M5_9ACTN|nr:LuxR C-terminal-related transcriptional regulator [Actinomadura macrotermitis]MQY09418.1 hypothetical protein [Actinomadura macrotermitis]
MGRGHGPLPAQPHDGSHTVAEANSYVQAGPSGFRAGGGRSWRTGSRWQPDGIPPRPVAGITTRSIARHLDICDKTVRNHIHAVFGKLDVHSRTEAALVAVQNRPLRP